MAKIQKFYLLAMIFLLTSLEGVLDTTFRTYSEKDANRKKAQKAMLWHDYNDIIKNADVIKNMTP